ncbi:hypothetical protein BD779DRAFT_174242 [Infundibulicybe gibba]|nr:hypothetical protein BD779DRAFT_174242 [Infundibulicybe gibba]
MPRHSSHHSALYVSIRQTRCMFPSPLITRSRISDFISPQLWANTDAFESSLSVHAHQPQHAHRTSTQAHPRSPPRSSAILNLYLLCALPSLHRDPPSCSTPLIHHNPRPRHRYRQHFCLDDINHSLLMRIENPSLEMLVLVMLYRRHSKRVCRGIEDWVCRTREGDQRILQ